MNLLTKQLLRYGFSGLNIGYNKLLMLDILYPVPRGSYNIQTPVFSKVYLVLKGSHFQVDDFRLFNLAIGPLAI